MFKHIDPRTNLWKVARVADVLGSQLQWLRQQQGGSITPDGAERVGWLVKCCGSLLNQSFTDYSQWPHRKNRAELIRAAVPRYTDRRNNKAVRDLVTLTIADLLASRLFHPEVQVAWYFQEHLAGQKHVAETTCGACGKPFGAKRRTAQFCSDRCRKGHQRSAQCHAKPAA